MKKHMFAIALGLAGAVAAGGAASAQEQGGEQYPPGEERSLDVDAFSTVCIKDAPWITYTIKPLGFVPEVNEAKLTIYDVNGKVIDVMDPVALSGTFLYPGAAVDEDGFGTEWPGWVFEDGKWRELPPGQGTSLWREGVKIRVDVNPTAFAEVTYPDASPVCAGPKPSATPPSGENPSQGSVSDPGELPRTGSDSINTTLQIAAALVIGGGLLAVGAHRRRSAAAA